jgi:hypothetical protein
MLEKLNCYVTRVSIFLIMAALIVGMVGCDGRPPCPCTTSPPSQNLEIRTWYDLNATRENLAGNHTLMNDLNSTTPGYEELASPAANQGKGWEPIGTFIPMCPCAGLTGTFDGQGYEIRDLYINRPDEDLVGLFGCVYEEGAIKDIGVINITVIGNWGVGGLVGRNIGGTVSNSYVIGNVSGDFSVGGLVGYDQGPVSNCYATGNVVAGGIVGQNVGAVIGGFGVGGLVGLSEGAPVSSCYFTGNVTSYLSCADKWKTLTGVGGLVGLTYGTVSNSYSNANVTGKDNVGGLVGNNRGTLSDSYSTGSVTGNSSVGGLVGWNFFSSVTDSYSTGNVTGNYTVGGLVGENEGEGTVSNSFWDRETSGQTTSAGGMGKTTAEMKSIATFTAWDIITVTSGQTNPTYTWNIIDDETYPFLSWEL